MLIDAKGYIIYTTGTSKVATAYVIYAIGNSKVANSLELFATYYLKHTTATIFITNTSPTTQQLTANNMIK